ncbi:MAG: trimeric intracellular cation channel family protein [Verrucomicrobia bacterium]|nr:trimeric intracellular cation channel family protein [Verrucomicrobiota bacterium]
MPAWFEQFAVAVCAISGALAATGKRLDLFGVIVLAVVTAVGGGTIRDLCLGAKPVFWIENPSHIVTATLTALATFVIVRFWTLSQRALLVADAFGLALFTIAGTEKTLLMQSSGVIAIMLGVITGVAGGLLRDVLRREIPLVFQAEIYLYATAAFCGATAFVALQKIVPDSPANRFIAMGIILSLRLAAIWWKLRLPVFKSRENDEGNDV